MCVDLNSLILTKKEKQSLQNFECSMFFGTAILLQGLKERYLFSIVRNILKFENLRVERAAFSAMLVFEKKKAIFKECCRILGLF